MQNATANQHISLFAKPHPVATEKQGKINMARAQIEEPESESDERLVDFLRLTRDWAWEADARLHLTYSSQRSFDVIGHHPEDLLGKPLTHFGNFVDKQGKPGHLSMNGNFRDACFHATDVQGKVRQLSISTIALFDPVTGAFQGIRGIARPLTKVNGQS